MFHLKGHLIGVPDVHVVLTDYHHHMSWLDPSKKTKVRPLLEERAHPTRRSSAWL